MELTAKQEAFCQAVLNPDNTQTDAYILAYSTPPETSRKQLYERASRLIASSKIKARIEELRSKEYLSKPWSVDQLRASLKIVRLEAADAGQHGASIRALEMIGKLDGLFGDKKEIARGIDPMKNELTTEELRQIVADGQRILGKEELAYSKPAWKRGSALP